MTRRDDRLARILGPREPDDRAPDPRPGPWARFCAWVDRKLEGDSERLLAGTHPAPEPPAPKVTAYLIDEAALLGLQQEGARATALVVDQHVYNALMGTKPSSLDSWPLDSLRVVVRDQ